MIQYNELNNLKSTTNIINFDVEYDIVKSKIDELFIKNNDCLPLC